MKKLLSLNPAPIDPIFGLNKAFLEDPRECKVNLGIGAYKTDALQPYVLPSVRAAEEILLKQQLNKEYLAIAGNEEFNRLVSELVYGKSIAGLGIFTAQSVGGTGALRVGAQFFAENLSSHIFLPSPTWDNHQRIFAKAGMKVGIYPYYDRILHQVHVEPLYASMEGMPEGSIMVLQACCHNPTGSDLTLGQWHEIAERIKKKGIIPFFDLAYQGFSEGLDADVKAIRLFADLKIPSFVAVSLSKNFGLYGERVGALIATCHEKSLTEKVASHLKVAIRSLYSNPPLQGARIVATILGSPALREQWVTELAGMRGRIEKNRKELIHLLDRCSEDPTRFHFMRSQVGMFAYPDLPSDAALQLQNRFGIFVPQDGRISLAGLNDANLLYVAKALAEVANTNSMRN